MNNLPIGLRLRIIREVRGFKQGPFARRVGKMQQTISHMEIEKQEIRVSELERFAEVLQVSITEFFADLTPPWPCNPVTVDWELLRVSADLSPASRAALKAFLETLRPPDAEVNEDVNEEEHGEA